MAVNRAQLTAAVILRQKVSSSNLSAGVNGVLTLCTVFCFAHSRLSLAAQPRLEPRAYK